MSVQTLDLPRVSLAEDPKIMRYWYFSEGKVAGPLDAAAMKGTQGFSMTMLVCPEDRSGTNADDWKPASEFPDFTVKAATAAAAPMVNAAAAMANKELADKIENLQSQMAEMQKKVDESLKNAEKNLADSIKELKENLNKPDEGVSRLQATISSQADELSALKKNLGTLAAALARQMPQPEVARPAPSPMMESRREEASVMEKSIVESFKVPAKKEPKKEGGAKKKMMLAAIAAVIAAIAGTAYYSMKAESAKRLAEKQAQEAEMASMDYAPPSTELPPPLPSIEESMTNKPEGGLQEIESFNAIEEPVKEPVKAAPKTKKKAAKTKKTSKAVPADSTASMAAPVAAPQNTQSAPDSGSVISAQEDDFPIENLPGMAPKAEKAAEKEGFPDPQ